MTKKLIFATILIVSGFSLNSTFAQDPHFSQFYANPLYLNPAFAGTAICPRLVMNYRNQWPVIPGNYVTYSASFDQHVDAISGGLGLLVNADRAGEATFTTQQISGIYSVQVRVTRDFSIKAGFQGTYIQKDLDWDKLRFPDMIDDYNGFVLRTSEVPPPNLSKSLVDFSAGILGYSENIFGGFAAHHLTEPDEALFSYSRASKLPMRLTAHAGYIIDIEGRRRRRQPQDPILSINFLYMQQRNFRTLNYGMYFNKLPFIGGIWYRQNIDNHDAIILLVGLEHEKFKFGYSYDLTVSHLTIVSGGAHEASFTLMFDCRPKKRRLRAISCPSF